MNEFIAEIGSPENLELFRSADPPTVFPGFPTLGSFASSATVNLQQTSTSQFAINYNVSTPGSFAGVFMDFGVSTPKNLTGFSKFTFEMKTDNTAALGNQIKIEFVDTNNNRGVKFISGLTSSFKQIDILPAEVNGANLASIKQIVFVIDSGIA